MLFIPHGIFTFFACCFSYLNSFCKDTQVALTLWIQKSTLVLNNNITALTQYYLPALLNTACSCHPGCYVHLWLCRPHVTLADGLCALSVCPHQAVFLVTDLPHFPRQLPEFSSRWEWRSQDDCACLKYPFFDKMDHLLDVGLGALNVFCLGYWVPNLESLKTGSFRCSVEHEKLSAASGLLCTKEIF